MRTPTPLRNGGEEQRYRVPFDAVVRELNTFWRSILVEVGVTYREPTVKTLDSPVVTACGPAGPEHFAFYCPAEEAIYSSPAGLDAHRQRIGDFAPIVVMAHEWGHHVQTLLGITPAAGNAFELQADCLAGAYARDAGQRGLLDPGDITEAVATSAEAGDPLGLPQDTPGTHGIHDDRITAFMRGYLDGVEACELPWRAPGVSARTMTGGHLALRTLSLEDAKDAQQNEDDDNEHDGPDADVHARPPGDCANESCRRS